MMNQNDQIIADQLRRAISQTDFHQMVMEEVANMNTNKAKPIQFVLKPTSPYFTQLQMIRAHSFPNIHPNDLLRFAIKVWWESLFAVNYDDYQKEMEERTK